MKKLLVTLILSAIILVGCSSGNVMSGYKGFANKDHHFYSTSATEFVENLENGVEGVYFMGFSDCPWCKEIVPVLEDIASKDGHSINYLNTRGNQYVNNKALQDRLSKWIATLPEADQNGGGVPFTIFIDKDGKVITHKGTVETHDAPSALMTENEMSFLVARLSEKFKTVTPQSH